MVDRRGSGALGAAAGRPGGRQTRAGIRPWLMGWRTQEEALAIALEHVAWLRRRGVPLSEAAAAIGVPATTWDQLFDSHTPSQLSQTVATGLRQQNGRFLRLLGYCRNCRNCRRPSIRQDRAGRGTS